MSKRKRPSSTTSTGRTPAGCATRSPKDSRIVCEENDLIEGDDNASMESTCPANVSERYQHCLRGVRGESLADLITA